LPQTRLDRSSAWFVDNETLINRGVRMTSQQSGGEQKWAYVLYFRPDTVYTAKRSNNQNLKSV
jgi:hypothetical protein